MIARIKEVDRPHQFTNPSYESVITILNAEGFKTSRGNVWTRRNLYRMLQREGFSGLYGLLKTS